MTLGDLDHALQLWDALTMFSIELGGGYHPHVDREPQLLRVPQNMAALAPSSGLGVCEVGRWELKPKPKNLL